MELGSTTAQEITSRLGVHSRHRASRSVLQLGPAMNAFPSQCLPGRKRHRDGRDDLLDVLRSCARLLLPYSAVAPPSHGWRAPNSLWPVSAHQSCVLTTRLSDSAERTLESRTLVLAPCSIGTVSGPDTLSGSAGQTVIVSEVAVTAVRTLPSGMSRTPVLLLLRQPPQWGPVTGLSTGDNRRLWSAC